jgi:sulfate/thiosulfate transport system permease protein
MIARLSLRLFALGYLGLLLALPVAIIFYRTFGDGFWAAWQSVTTPDAVHALWLTLIIAAVAVPANAIFGVLCALLLVRHRFPGRFLLSAFIDLPLGVSPVVVGLALILVYGRFGWLGGWLDARGIQVIFALPGMTVATIFVSLPFVAREVIPVLHEIGTEQEQAARTLGASAWQTFRRITLPSIRMGLGYGLVLSVARAIGEFGAVSVVSGKILGQTETMTLLVQDRFDNFDLRGAYAASLVLALMALATLFTMNIVNRRSTA